MKGRLGALLYVAITLGLVVCYRVATRTLVLGSVAGRWTYTYLYRFDVRWMRAMAVVMAMCAMAAVIPASVTRRYKPLIVLLWFALALLAQGQLRTVAPYSLSRVFLSDGSGGYYTVARKYSAHELLADFDRVRPAFPIHPRGNMPGKVLFVKALGQITDRPDVMVWLMFGVSSLGAILMYVITRELTADSEIALYSLILYLFVPARAFFAGVPNSVTPVCVLAVIYLWLRAVRSPGSAWAVAAGVAAYAMAFFEPLPLVTGIVLCAMVVCEVSLRELSVKDAVRRVVAAAGGFALTFLIVRVGLGFDLLSTFRALLKDAADFNVVARRPYSIWVTENLFDFAFASGIVPTMLCFSLLLPRVRAAIAPRAVVFCSALLACLLITDALGINRGEIPRLWIFLACLVQIPAAIVIARLNHRAALAVVLTVTLVQTTLGTAMFAFAQP